MKVQDVSSETDKWASGRVGMLGDLVWSYLSPLSIKGKQCDRADTAGESQSNPFTMKEEMG